MTQRSSSDDVAFPAGEPIEAILRALATRPAIAMALLDREMCVRFVNAAAETAAGLPAARTVGRSVEQVWPVIGPHLRADAQRCLDTGEAVLGHAVATDFGALAYDVLPVHGVTGVERVLVVVRDMGASSFIGPGSYTHTQYVMVDVMGRLARMTADDSDAVLNRCLALVAEAFGCDRAVARMLSSDGTRFVISHRYDSPALARLTSADDGAGAHASILADYASGETIAFSSLDAISPAYAGVRDRMKSVGCQSACGVPITHGDKLLGRVAFLCVDEREWSETVQMRLRLFGEMFGIAFSRVRAEIELRERLAFERALATVSSRLMDIAPAALEEELVGTLKSVTTALGMDRTILCQLDDAREHFTITHEWCLPGVASFRQNATGMTIAAFGWPLTKVFEGETISLTLDEIPEDAVTARRVIGGAGIRAMVLLPLTLHGDVIGCALFQSLTRASRMPEDLLARLRVIGDVLASALVRRRAAESLREAEARFTQVIESALDGVVVLDATGVVLEWTPQSERLFGRPRHVVVGRRFVDVAIDPKDQARFSLTADGTPKEARLELTGAHRDGRAFPIEISIAPLKRAGVTIFALFVRDITDRKRAEQERQRAFDELARQRETAERERDYLREEMGTGGGHSAILGSSAAIRRALESLDAVASTNAAVLVHGESGVGKELFARALHTKSKRAAAPLVKVNCASIPESLFESEFFGHVRGSFTGAHKDRVGRFELADGGTLFLDEVGEIPLDMQAKLLRVLQEGEFERVGDDRTRRVDVRLVAATNRDLPVEVQNGRFRRDLYYRLSVFPIDVPPLRERPDDIVPLAQHYLRRLARSAGRPQLVLTQAHEAALLEYDWPGNIRELEHVIERAVIRSPAPPLRLDLALSGGAIATTSQSGLKAARGSEGGILTDEELRKLERDNVLAALEKASGRISGDGGAAGLLKVNPSTLRDRMKALGIARRG